MVFEWVSRVAIIHLSLEFLTRPTRYQHNWAGCSASNHWWLMTSQLTSCPSLLPNGPCNGLSTRMDQTSRSLPHNYPKALDSRTFRSAGHSPRLVEPSSSRCVKCRWFLCPHGRLHVVCFDFWTVLCELVALVCVIFKRFICLPY